MKAVASRSSLWPIFFQAFQDMAVGRGWSESSTVGVFPRMYGVHRAA